MKANNIEELFGTLQQSVVASWRKHLKTDKYSNHEALDEFYKEMPELVDKLIEDWMGVNGKVEEYKNIIDSEKISAIEYLNKLKELVKSGYELVDEKELQSDLDSIASQIDSTLYKLKELKEDNINLSKYLKERLLNEAKAISLDTFVNFDLRSDIYNILSDLAFEYEQADKKFDEKDVKKALNWFMKNFFVANESLNESASTTQEELEEYNIK